MAKLINGNGNPAIYAAEDADLIASLAGNVTCIANVGNKYAATEEDATTIRLDDGVIITKEGRRIQLEAGESDTFYVPTGTSGHTNYYIIGYKLVQNADSTQVAEQFVQKMNSSTATITEDTFRGGATEVYVSLYRITQVDFTITNIDGLLPELTALFSIGTDIISEATDFNNLIEKEKYIINVAGCANSPDPNSGGQLFASSNKQVYITDHGRIYVRYYLGGYWHSWKEQYVKKTGDTITGDLTLSNGATILAGTLDLKYSQSVYEGMAWKNAPARGHQVYYYEGADTQTLDLPDTNCFVEVIKRDNSRGVAFAYVWPNGAPHRVYMNINHETWKGWQLLH